MRIVACVLAGTVMVGCSGSDDLPDQAQEPTPPIDATTTTVASGIPEAMALDDTCPRLEDALKGLHEVALVGEDAISAIGHLRDQLPSSHRPYAETILAMYVEIENGYTDVLLEPDRVVSATEAGDALETYLAETCDLELVAS